MGLREEGERIDSLLLGENKEYLDRIKEIEAKIPKLEEQKRAAAAFGDLSENSEYTAATEELARYAKEKGELELKLRQFEGEYSSYVTTDKSRGDLVGIGSVVRITFTEANRKFIVKIVPQKADAPRMGAIASTSPLGRALLNKRAGENTVVVTERRKWNCAIEEVY